MTFIRLVSLFVANVTSPLEVIILAFLVLIFVPLDSLLSLQVFESRRFFL